MVNASVRLLGHGSGVFIYDDVILTAAHCLEGVETISIKMSDDTVLKSGDFYIDDEEDVAFIFVAADELCIAKVVLSRNSLGDIVYLVGRPFNGLFEFSLTKGIISHLSRDISEWNWKDLLQVDANGGPGSSGGPLYNSAGNLIGVYVGHSGNGGVGISLCESSKSILEAYERCMNARGE
jgi:serine protease Do